MVKLNNFIDFSFYFCKVERHVRHISQHISGCGGTGRRAGFRFQ